MFNIFFRFQLSSLSAVKTSIKMENVSAHDRPPVTYKDILKDRHDESDMMWVSRQITTTKAYRQSKEVKNPSSLQDLVLKSPRIQKLIEDVSVVMK